MENLAHTLTGIALSRTGLGRKVPGGTLTLVLAANLPDLDVVSGLGGSLYYLHYHRGSTHGLFGTVLLGLLLAAIAWSFQRGEQARIGSPIHSSGIIILTALSHPLLDYTNAYGLQPFLPFNETRVFGDLVFIVDPYLWIILGTSVFLTARRNRLSRMVWIIAVAAVVLVGVALAVRDVKGIWFLFCLLLAILLAGLLKRRQSKWGPAVAVYGLGLVIVYWAVLWVCHHEAGRTALSQIRQVNEDFEEEELVILPRLANPLTWDVFFQDPQRIYYGQAGSFSKEMSAFRSYAKNLDNPAVQAALATCPGSILSAFGRFEFFEVQESSEGTVVIYRDARFTRERESGFGVFKIVLDPNLVPETENLACPD